MNVYISLSWYFLNIGLLLGSWISRIPDIKDQLNFSNTQLGLLMLVAAVGAILALPLSSGIIDCLGSARTLLMGNILLFVSLPLVGMSRLAGAIGGVFFLGFGVALSDVAMTAHGITVEKLKQTIEMGKFGALNGIGNVIGSLCGGYLASIDCSPQTHFFYVSVLCLPISLVMYYWLINSSKERKFLANGGVLMIAGGSGYVSGHSTSGGGNLFRGYSTSSSTMSNKYDDYYTSSNNPSRDYYSSGEYLIPPASYYGDDSDESEDSDTYLGADGLAAQIRNQGHSARPLLQPLYATPPTPQSYSDSQASSFMESSTQHSPQKIIRFLCILGFVSELINGTITEWCTVFFKEELNASPLMSTVGYAVFSACGAVCMLLSDMLVKRYFRQTVIRCSGCMGLVGLSLVALAGFVDTWCDIEHFPLYLAILGLAVAGGSISCVVPIVFSAAGDIPQVKPSTSVPMVTSVSYVAYQCGPPLFGYLSDVLGGLKFVFIILAGLSALLVFFPGHVPHNRYGMLMLLTSRRMKHQSTDFMWQEDSRGSTPGLAVVDHNNSTDVDDESESDSDIVSDSGATAGDGDDRYNSGRSDGSHFEEIKKKPARSNKHLYDNTSSENNTLSSGTNDSASTNNVNTSENNMNNGSKKSDKIKAINKHLSKNRFPVF